MQGNSAEEAQSPLYLACPFLGSADDRNTRAIFPSESNSCFSDPNGNPIPIHLEHQAQFCLNGNHVQCPRFLGLDETPRVIAQPEKPPRHWSARTRALYAVAMVALIALVFYASWRVFNTVQTANADAEATVAVVSAETPTETSPASDTPAAVSDEGRDETTAMEDAGGAGDDHETDDGAADVDGAGDNDVTTPDDATDDIAAPGTDAQTDANDEAQPPVTDDETGDADIAAADTVAADDPAAPEATPRATPDPAIPLILPPTATPEPDAEEASSEDGAEAATDLDDPATQDQSAEDVNETVFVLSFPGGNLRTGPSTANPIVTVVPEGTAVVVLGRTPAYWFYVRLDNGVEGWLAYSVFQQPDADQAAAVPVISP